MPDEYGIVVQREGSTVSGGFHGPSGETYSAAALMHGPIAFTTTGGSIRVARTDLIFFLDLILQVLKAEKE